MCFGSMNGSHHLKPQLILLIAFAIMTISLNVCAQGELQLTPDVIGSPTWTKPGILIDTIVRLDNIGDADINFSAVNIYYDAGMLTGWIWYIPALSSISYQSPSFVDVTLTLGGGITTDGIGLTGGIEFIFDGANSPDTLPIYMIVADTVQFPEYAVIHTDCMPLIMNNAGQLGEDLFGNSNSANMNFYDDCDTTNNGVYGEDDNPACYLREASPFILRITEENDTVLYNYMYNTDWVTNDGFRPLYGIEVDSTTDPSMMVGYTGKFLTRDSLLTLEREIYAPQHPDSCKFFVQKLFVYHTDFESAGDMEDLFIGELMDWDIPSDSGVENGSGYDGTRQLMYMFGGEYGDDTVENNDCVLADQRYGGMAYYGGYRIPNCLIYDFNVDSFPISMGAWTHTNANWIEPTGNFDPQMLYNEMYAFSGYEPWEALDPGLEDSLYQDLHMVSIYGRFDLGILDTLIFVHIYSSTYDGLSDLQANIDMARNWISEHDIFEWPPLQTEGCPDDLCEEMLWGDINGNGFTDLLDVLELICIVYQGCPIPSHGCMNIIDVNGDGEINLLDILALIGMLYPSSSIH